MSSLKSINPYLFKYKYRLLLGVFFVTASNLFAVFPAQSVRIAIDMVKENLERYNAYQHSILQVEVRNEVGSVLLYFTAIVIVLALFRGVFMYLMRQSIIVMSRLIEFDLKNDIFKHYQLLSMSFYRRNSTGDLMARISEDVSRVRMYVGPAIMYAINLIVTIVLVLWAMFSVNGRLSLLVILPLPILSYAIFKVNHLINHRSDLIQEQLSKLTTFVQEAFSGIRVVKAFAAENQAQQAFEALTSVYKEKQISLAKVDALFFPLMFLLTGLSTLITIFAGGFEVINGRATIGNIAEFVIYVNMLTWPVASLGYTTSLIQRAAASQSRINQFLETKPEIVSTSKSPFHFSQEIRFENVSFTYPGMINPAIHHVSFVLKKGESLAILGTTGSGKSTIANLLLRMFDPQEGAILIDGVNLREINLDAFRQRLGYVPQEVFLFSDTIRNNINFGVDDESGDLMQRTEKAAIQAALMENIQSFPDGFETLVGERGVTLSGGQKQRLAIARAFMKNPSILVLDDCLSALDTKTESEILGQLQEIKKDKTALIISHRASSVRNASYILVLDQGSVIEMGTHEDLLSKQGKYAEIFERQMLEDVAVES